MFFLFLSFCLFCSVLFCCALTLIIKREGALASERATDHRAIRLPSALQFTSEEGAAHLICNPPPHPGQIR